MHNISLIPRIWDRAHRESAMVDVRFGKVEACNASRKILMYESNLELSTSDFINSVIMADLRSLRCGCSPIYRRKCVSA